MTLPACKKVTFQETPNQYAQPQSSGSNYNEEPFATLSDPSHSCEPPLPPGVIMVNPCIADVSGEGSQPSKNQEIRGDKSFPCTQTQLVKPKEEACRPKIQLASEIKPKIICPVTSEKLEKPHSACVSNVPPPHDILSDKLKQMKIEDDFRRENPIMRKQLFKYRGICGTLGNPVFTNTPVASPGYKAKPGATRVPGYPSPAYQHPMYKTTSGDYGSSEPYLETTPIVFFPNNQSFSIVQAIGGPYEDAHLTTETDKDFLW